MADVQFDFIPSYSSSKAVTPRITLVRFGDGYVQRGASGINLFPQKWDLNFTNIRDTQADDIEAALQSAAGGTLLWKPPPANGALDPYVKFMCLGWKRTVNEFDSNNLTCELEQVFE